MKKTDIALLIIIVSLSAGISYWIVSATMGKANEEPIVVRTIDSIDVSEQKVDTKVFHADAINPTVEAMISGTDITSFIDEGDEASQSDDSSGQASEE